MTMIIETIEDNIDKKDVAHLEPRIGARAVFFKDGKLCMLYLRNKDRYTLPGGGVEKDETPQTAVKREVLEETGYAVTKASETLILKEYFTDSIWHHHFFHCEISGGQKRPVLTKEEVEWGLAVVFKPLDEALRIFADYESSQPDPYTPNIHKRELMGLIHSL